MKKNIVKINENTLKQIVAESVKKVLKEGYLNTEEGNTDFFEYEQKIMSLIDECDDSLLLLRIIEKAAGNLSSIAVKDETNRRDKWFINAKQWADKVRQEASMLSD